ncbi:uncharacterized protein E5676_scaffold306G00490 [Cucumis melo var. makuwa]|uniref:Uncharacterized protein n=1 Tax=Cucumis melo var. makuwa TaxID=1194695 RepID=A0A5D3D0N2_CUCMM|nr:uncharacterized protein E5676_scaffold306G00490 [Cucumis melo var. makuwa]
MLFGDFPTPRHCVGKSPLNRFSSVIYRTETERGKEKRSRERHRHFRRPSAAIPPPFVAALPRRCPSPPSANLDDPKNGSNWKVVQVIQNKRIWDVPEVEDVQNDHINILKVVVSHQVDDHIEDDTLCRNDVDPTIVERPVVRHVTDDFIDDVDEHLSHASDEEL